MQDTPSKDKGRDLSLRLPWSSSQANLGSHLFSDLLQQGTWLQHHAQPWARDELWTQENVHGGWRTLWSWCALQKRDDLMEQGTREGAGRRARMTETCSEGRESTRDRQQIKFWTPLQGKQEPRGRTSWTQ